MIEGARVLAREESFHLGPPVPSIGDVARGRSLTGGAICLRRARMAIAGDRGDSELLILGAQARRTNLRLLPAGLV